MSLHYAESWVGDPSLFPFKMTAVKHDLHYSEESSFFCHFIPCTGYLSLGSGCTGARSSTFAGGYVRCKGKEAVPH